MTDILQVHINGDRSKFKSKNCIKKFKIKIKKSLDNLNKDLYLKNGYNFDINKDDNKIYVKIINDIKISNNNIDKRNKLRQKLKSLKNLRNGKSSNYIKKLKKEIPKNVLKSYIELNKKFNIPIPKPDEILKDPKKFEDMIKIYASNANLSPDNNMNNMLRNYFKSLSNFLNIEP